MPEAPLPPIVGRKEMAAMLGVHSNNSHRDKLPDLPQSLQERYPDLVDVAATQLWLRSDVEEYMAKRDAAKREAAKA